MLQGHAQSTEEVAAVVRFSDLRGTLRAFACAMMLAACGSLEPRVGPPPAQSPAAESDRWRGTLIYAGGDVESYLLEFPKGNLIKTFGTTVFGACSDRSGNVFLAQVSAITEYAHGGTTPIATYAVPGSAYSCSIDPTTGKLAAVVFCFKQCGNEVVVFGTHGDRARYRDPAVRSLLFCAYDDSGNLFVDGYSGTNFALLELAKGTHVLATIALKQPIADAGQIQWDGRDLAVETRLKPVIFRVGVSGSSARIVGRVHLDGVGYRATQSWIQNGKIAVPTGRGTKRATEIVLWDYPAGGNPTKIFTGFVGGGHQMIDAVTFSTPPRR